MAIITRFMCFRVCVFLIGMIYWAKVYDSADELLDTWFPCHPDQRFNASDWYHAYVSHIRWVRKLPHCEECINDTITMNDACERWWHPTPQRDYKDKLPRKWSGVLRQKNQNITQCGFGQALRPEMKCAASYRHLFQVLSSLHVVYFPRSGTELGIVRDSAYLSDDGDLDIYVDMPQQLLNAKLRVLLQPETHIDGQGTTADVHWNVIGCPVVHMMYNDYISDELQHRAQPSDLCTCRLNSVDLLCHRDGPKRMYTQYGPSWRIPLGVKQLDMPYWASTHKTDRFIEALSSKLMTMVNTTSGRIEAESISAWDVKKEDVRLILAQLNILAGSLDLLIDQEK